MAPLAAMNDLLHDPRTWATQFDSVAATQAAVAQLFPTLDDVHRVIPSINVEPFAKLPTLNGRLVRFHGMVQDTSLSPQVYPLQWRGAPGTAPGTSGSSEPVTTQSGAWTDALPDAILSPATQVLSYGDRQPIYLVSVPGEPLPVADLAYPSDTLVGSSKAAAKFPVPNAPHQAIVAKLYSPAPIEPRIGQVVEVVGVLEVELDVPVTVHVMWACDLGKKTVVDRPTDVAQARAELVRYLASHLGGDEVAAEYVLLHVIMRGDSVAAQAAGGAGAMGIVAAAGLRAGIVTDALQKMGVAAAWLPLSRDVLQKDVFAPRAALLAVQENAPAPGAALDAAATAEQIMDEPEGILAGRLQLAHGSVLVVDETAMTEGKLNEHAVRNLQALASVAQARVLPCEFPYSRVDLPIDYAILVVSESTKPIVPCQVRVPLAPTGTAVIPQLAPSAAASAYLTWALSAPACKLGDDAVAKAIERAYVADRQRAAATGASSSASGGVDTCGQEQLHWQLALARALGRSRGEATVTMDIWETVRALEKTRIARLTEAAARTAPAGASRAS